MGRAAHRRARGEPVADARAGARGHRSHAAHPPACPRGLGVSGRAAPAVEHAGEARRAYGHHVYPAAFGRPLWGGRARMGQPGRGVMGGVQPAGAQVWRGGLGAGVGSSPTRAFAPCSGGAVDLSRLHEPRGSGRDVEPEGGPATTRSLIPHFGGYQYAIGVEFARNFCLMRVRPEIPLISGCRTRAYLPTSQNKFWQSISCRRRPHSEWIVAPIARTLFLGDPP